MSKLASIKSIFKMGKGSSKKQIDDDFHLCCECKHNPVPATKNPCKECLPKTRITPYFEPK